MHGEEHSAQLVVKVDGRELPADVHPYLTSAVVDARRDAPGLFVLHLADEHGVLLDKAGIRIGSVVALQVQLSGSGGPTPLATGEVTSLETEIGPGGRRTTVRGFDKGHRLAGSRRTATYVGMSASDVVSKIAGEHGLSGGRIEATTGKLDHLWQPNISDWDMLQRLADMSGSVVGVSDGRLDFRRPTAATGAPAGATGSRQDPLVVEQGVNLLDLRATVTAASQVSKVEARGWDPKTKKAVVASETPATNSARLAATDPARLGKVFGGAPLVVSSTGLATQQQAAASAKTVSDRVAGGFAEIEATVRGNPQIAVGRPIALAGCGDPFDGKYVVSSVRHEFSGELGYRTHLTVSDASDRSTYGTVAGPARGGARGAALYPAVVTATKDPDKAGRVKVKIPALHDSLESWWVRVVSPGAGKEHGLFALPEVGDEVLVALAEGELDQPYVLGGLYSPVDVPPAPGQKAEYVDANSGEVTRRCLVSRSGMYVELVDAARDERIVLSDKDGKVQVVIAKKPDAAIEITSSGPVTVNAKQKVEVTAEQDVTCTSKTGNVTVKGVKVALQGTSEIDLKAPKVSITADAQLALKGAMATLAGTGTTEVSSSGVTTVKGSLVKIN
ncbi:VgrG-related protein [Cellulosimicrobium arenosum]|uniref:VgrG-related protein n=1 Tax=Cellulosimicrobium arenosum TaxID=2708133 RepID=A0A927PGA2_9MICO|nr:VgrG-related protein [Cellulosimicrobium arenosum]